jgi:hypothetical protein
VHIPHRFNASLVGQFEEALGRHAQAKAPLLGCASLEIGKFFAQYRVHQNIRGGRKYGTLYLWQAAAIVFKLFCIHRFSKKILTHHRKNPWRSTSGLRIGLGDAANTSEL